jgi:hypothetical protein
MTERPPICCLCWLDGIQSPAIIKGWDGVPICREHLAESVARTSGQPTITPSPGFTAATMTLQ